MIKLYIVVCPECRNSFVDILGANQGYCGKCKKFRQDWVFTEKSAMSFIEWFNSTNPHLFVESQNNVY